MKIVLVANSAYKLVNFRLNLLVGLIRSGYDLTAVVPNDAYVKDLEDIGVKVIITNRRLSYRSIFSYLKFISVLIGVLVSQKPNLILSFTIVPNLLAGFLARLLKIKFIPNVTGRGRAFSEDGLIANYRIKILLFLHRVCFRTAYKVFVQNRDDYNFFVGHKIVEFDRCIVLPGSGVDLRKYSRIEVEKRFDFGFVGRLLLEKGILDFLIGLKQLQTRGETFNAVVLGAFSENVNPQLKTKICNLMDELGVHYLGHQSDVVPILAQLKWLVLPSYYNEGTPRSLLEGAAMGVGILTTNRPGCRDVVLEGYNGFLFEPKNQYQLTEAMLKVLHFKDKSFKSFSEHSRRLAEEKFSDKIIEEHYMNLIQKLIFEK